MEDGGAWDAVLERGGQALTRLLQHDHVSFVEAVLKTPEVQDFIAGYLAHRHGLCMAEEGGIIISSNSSRSSPLLPRMDQLVLSTVYRLVCASGGEDHQQQAPAAPRSRDLLAASHLHKLPVLAHVCSLLGEANQPISAQIVAAALALQPSPANFYRDMLEMFRDLEVGNAELLESCLALASPHQPKVSSTNKASQAKVVSLSAQQRRPTLAEKAKAAATAALVSTSAAATAAVAPAPKRSETELHDLRALAIAVADKSHALASLLAALPAGLLFSPELDVMRKQGSDSFVGAAGESVLQSLQQAYEQIIPAIAGAKSAWLKGAEGSAGAGAGAGAAAAQYCAEIDRLLTFASRRLVGALVTILEASTQAQSSSSVAPTSQGSGTIWPVMLERLLSQPPGAQESEWLSGTLLADAFKTHDRGMAAAVRGVCSDPEQGAYFVEVLSQHHTAGLFPPVTAIAAAAAAAAKPPAPPSSSSKAPAPASVVPDQQKMQAAVAAVLSIFSDVGDGFAAACLQTFDWDVDRTVDALLSDNLPPTLRKLDRSLKHVWIGKGGPDGGRAVGSIGASAEKVYALPPESESFKRAQKERLLAEERKREEDFFLMAAEYQDDYDDQWDDASAPVQPNDASSSSAQSKGGKGKGDNRSVAQKIQWEVQMDRMKRVNNLIREKEAEEQYWAEMRNTNHEKPTREDAEGPGVSAAAALGAGAKPQLTARGGRGGGAGNNSGGSKGGGDRGGGDRGGGDRGGGGEKGGGRKEGSGGKGGGGKGGGGVKAAPSAEGGGDKGPPRTQKPRTKTFDKHHAKDKTLKGRAFL